MNRPAEALAAKELNDGRIAYVIPNPFNAYITVACKDSDAAGTYDEVYTYEQPAGALVGLMLWHGDDDEPVGWIRHQPSNRRRHEGDPAREYVYA